MQRAEDGSDETISIESIIEAAMQEYVVTPLYSTIFTCILQELAAYASCARARASLWPGAARKIVCAVCGTGKAT
jgi:hypothetical protein